MRLQACLNGARPLDTPGLPVTPDEVARDAQAVCGLGAVCLHIHPRDSDGAESLAPADVAAHLRAVREAVPGIPVGISTGDWITPRFGRLEDMQGWTERPDYVSVNLCEPDAGAVIALMRQMGIGIELGLASLADLGRLPAGAQGMTRAMIEMNDADVAAAETEARAMLQALRQRLPDIPVLLHGFDGTAWDFIRLAADWGCDETRIGMEDRLTLPDGRPADNAALIGAALDVIGAAGTGTTP